LYFVLIHSQHTLYFMALMRYLNPDDAVLDDLESKRVFADICSNKQLQLLVALNDQIIVGTCYLNIIPNLTRQASPYAVLENVITDPNFRRRGVGKALMHAAMDTAAEAGCYKLMLLTGRDENVHRFYLSCGFEGDAKRAFVKRWSAFAT